jgi:hypothetical protein
LKISCASFQEASLPNCESSVSARGSAAAAHIAWIWPPLTAAPILAAVSFHDWSFCRCCSSSVCRSSSSRRSSSGTSSLASFFCILASKAAVASSTSFLSAAAAFAASTFASASRFAV